MHAVVVVIKADLGRLERDGEGVDQGLTTHRPHQSHTTTLSGKHPVRLSEHAGRPHTVVRTCGCLDPSLDSRSLSRLRI